MRLHKLVRAAAFLCVAGLAGWSQSKTSGTMSDPTRKEDPWFKKNPKAVLPANERVLRVTVRNVAGDVLPQAIVSVKQLDNGKTRTGITSPQGQYEFTQLERSADYEIVAEYKGEKSPVRKMSKFLPDQRVSMVVRIGEAPKDDDDRPEPARSTGAAPAAKKN